MKKLLCILLSLMMLASLCACGGDAQTPATEAPTAEAPTAQATEAAPAQVYYNTQWDGKTLKVLCVGNSFARNATKVLYQIAEAHGVEQIVLGVLHIGGCTVQKHWNNAQTDAAAYKYYKNTEGKWELTDNASLLYGLLDEQWDVITITQGQGMYGIPKSYDGCLEELVDYIEKNKTNPDAQIAFHMTWAFPPDSTNERFDHYANNQEIMFQCIVDTARDRILTVDGIDFLLPSGSAIQNVRTATGEVLFDDDKFHLNANGEYVAGYVWFAYLTGQPIDELKYMEGSAVAPMKSSHAAILEGVNAAFADPFTAVDLSK